MAFAMGFAVWIALGLLGGFVMYFFYRGPETTQLMTIVLSVFGAFIGGMLGMSPYIHHAPLPLRLGVATTMRLCGRSNLALGAAVTRMMRSPKTSSRTAFSVPAVGFTMIPVGVFR